MIFCNELLLENKLENSFIFLDNNILIALMELEELRDFFQKTHENKCFITIPPIVAEFLSVKDWQSYNKRSKFVNATCFTYPIERVIDPSDPIFFVFNKLYTSDLFDRVYSLSNDATDLQIRNYALYRLNPEKLERLISIHTQTSK